MTNLSRCCAMNSLLSVSGTPQARPQHGGQHQPKLYRCGFHHWGHLDVTASAWRKRRPPQALRHQGLRCHRNHLSQRPRLAPQGFVRQVSQDRGLSRKGRPACSNALTTAAPCFPVAPVTKIGFSVEFDIVKPFKRDTPPFGGHQGHAQGAGHLGDDGRHHAHTRLRNTIVSIRNRFVYQRVDMT